MEKCDLQLHRNLYDTFIADSLKLDVLFVLHVHLFLKVYLTVTKTTTGVVGVQYHVYIS